MFLSEKKIIKCKWCGAEAAIGNAPKRMPTWDRWLCKGCGSIGYCIDPSLDELNHVYQTAWHDAVGSGQFAAGSTSERIAYSLISVLVGQSKLGSCLDYGGGKGVLAKTLVRLGSHDVSVFEPFGTDPKTPGVSWFSSWHDFPSDKKFDYIFMVEVIEHLLDPVEELRQIRERLSSSGKLIITTPNARGWHARLDGTNWREAQNPTHINLFSPLAIKACLKFAGFKQVKRVLKPVRYNANGLSALALALTQIFGIDGGIRIIAS